MRSVMCIAGSDSGGAAGLQADLRAVQYLGLHGLSVVTAITAQDSLAVHGVWPSPAAAVRAQIAALLTDDYDIGAVKIGMLANEAVARAVVDGLEGFGGPVVLDPVMVSTTGRRLLEEQALAVVVERLMPRADLITPNVPEAELLLQCSIDDQAAAVAAVQQLGSRSGGAVLLKGGHLDGPLCVDLLWVDGHVTELALPRLEAKHSRGTGCTLSSLIAGLLCSGSALPDAVSAAKNLVHDGIVAGVQVAAGPGPVRL